MKKQSKMLKVTRKSLFISHPMCVKLSTYMEIAPPLFGNYIHCRLVSFIIWAWIAVFIALYH